jgi:hypothetical protein
MKKKDNIEILKFKWENDFEYKYRKTIHEISTEVQKVMGTLANLHTGESPDYSPVLEIIQEQYNKLVKQDIPLIYLETNKLLVKGYQYYIKAFKRLIYIFENMNLQDQKTFSEVEFCGKLIECGTAYVKICSISNNEIFREKEFGKFIIE